MFTDFTDGLRKASESSLQMQQELFNQWTRLWSAPPGAGAAAGAAEWNGSAPRRWLELSLEMLHKHREALVSTYRAGIELIERTFHVADARSPEDYRKVVEDVWRRLFELQKEQAESQSRDFQAWLEKSTVLVRDARA
jgi:hypothetical protein